jgi:hypothetical protein
MINEIEACADEETQSEQQLIDQTQKHNDWRAMTAFS